MQNLDNISDFKTLDKGRTLESITFFPNQIQSAWEQAQQISLPDTYKGITCLLFCGMGGSAYAGRIIKSLYSDRINIPIDIVSDYHLPSYVNEKTLVLVASYSGDTQESISCCEEALKLKTLVLGISKNGLLSYRLKKMHKPALCFDDKYNPSKQPRMGQGYMITGQLALLTRLNLLKISSNDIINIGSLLRMQQEKIGPIINTDINIAKKLATEFKDKIIILCAAQFLAGALHAVQNPLHETGKHLAFYTVLPETNHHLMEGLRFPKIVRDHLVFLFINSQFYSKSISIRQKLTQEVVKQNGINYFTLDLDFPDRLSQVFELLNYGNYITYYLAMLHDSDPALVPYVDYFKNKLKEEK